MLYNLSNEECGTQAVVIPKSLANQDLSYSECANYCNSAVTTNIVDEHQEVVSRCSTFTKIINIYKYLLLFVNKLKLSLKLKNGTKFAHLSVKDDHNFYAEAFNLAVSRDQDAHYSDVFHF